MIRLMPGSWPSQDRRLKGSFYQMNDSEPEGPEYRMI
jgi:hypothetical protein